MHNFLHDLAWQQAERPDGPSLGDFVELTDDDMAELAEELARDGDAEREQLLAHLTQEHRNELMRAADQARREALGLPPFA